MNVEHINEGTLNPLMLASVMLLSFSKVILYMYAMCIPGGPDAACGYETDGVSFPLAGLPEFQANLLLFAASPLGKRYPFIKIGTDMGNIKIELTIAPGRDNYY